MSVALSKIRDRVREQLNDTDPDHATYDPIRVDMAVAESYLLLSAQLPAPLLYTASAFTITGSGDTFSLPTTVSQWTGGDGQAEYRNVNAIQLVRTGTFLIKLTNEELDAYRANRPAVVVGVPEFYTIYENKTPVVTGRVWPGAAQDEACNLTVRLEADDLRDFVGTGAQGMDVVEVQFSRTAAGALMWHVAADFLEAMPAEELAKRRLSGKNVAAWRANAATMLYAAEAAIHDAAEIGRVQRLVS